MSLKPITIHPKDLFDALFAYPLSHFRPIKFVQQASVRPCKVPPAATSRQLVYCNLKSRVGLLVVHKIIWNAIPTMPVLFYPYSLTFITLWLPILPSESIPWTLYQTAGTPRISLIYHPELQLQLFSIEILETDPRNFACPLPRYTTWGTESYFSPSCIDL